jgi:hypothetical protein
MTGTLTPQVIVGMGAIQARRCCFDIVFSRAHTPVTGRWEAMRVWFRHHPECEPWGVLVLRGQEPVAAAVLGRQRKAGLWRITKPGEGGDPLRLATTSDQAGRALAEGIRDAMDGFGGPWTFWFPGLPQPDLVVTSLQSLWPNAKILVGVPVPYLPFATA